MQQLFLEVYQRNERQSLTRPYQRITAYYYFTDEVVCVSFKTTLDLKYREGFTALQN